MTDVVLPINALQYQIGHVVRFEGGEPVALTDTDGADKPRYQGTLIKNGL